MFIVLHILVFVCILNSSHLLIPAASLTSFIKTYKNKSITLYHIQVVLPSVKFASLPYYKTSVEDQISKINIPFFSIMFLFVNVSPKDSGNHVFLKEFIKKVSVIPET